MRLSALSPHWITKADVGGHWEDKVETQVEAQGIRFLCPLCFAKIGSARGTPHSVIVPFAGRGWPDAYLPGMGDKQPDGTVRRWTAEGTNFDNLTVKPSVLLSGSGCGWHGFITNGEASII